MKKFSVLILCLLLTGCVTTALDGTSQPDVISEPATTTEPETVPQPEAISESDDGSQPDITLSPGEEKIPLDQLDLDLLAAPDSTSLQTSQTETNSTSSLQSPEIPGGAEAPANSPADPNAIAQKISIDSDDNFVSPLIYSTGTHTDKELYKFFCSHSKQNRSRAKKIAKLYIEECAAEGINSDVAFIQMCHETNFLRYGNLVKKEWNNFCGLGAIDENQPGLRFKTMRLGVRAHIQHLHAYATPEDIVLKNECIDPRYKYVRPRAKATTVEGLSGTWAADKMYAVKLLKYLKELENF